MHAKHANVQKLNDLSRQVIGCALTVLNTLGTGFLEKVYENALAHEIDEAGLSVAQQCGARVEYKGILVGEYFVDLLVENMLLVELKAVKSLDEIHAAELRQAMPGDQARGPQPVNRTEPFACFACICLYLR